MKKLLICSTLAIVVVTACTPNISPYEASNLSCLEISDSLGELSLERNTTTVLGIAGATAIGVLFGPWFAIPAILAPNLRGDRGEFALKVTRVIKKCPGE